jgi:hypothetical protein
LKCSLFVGFSATTEAENVRIRRKATNTVDVRQRNGTEDAGVFSGFPKGIGWQSGLAPAQRGSPDDLTVAVTSIGADRMRYRRRLVRRSYGV